MPLTEIQRTVVDVLRPFRDQHNYIAGGAALNQDWPRLSDDMDIFYDLRNQLPLAVEPELQALRDAGFSIDVVVNDPLIVEAILTIGNAETKIEWFDDPDTCKRFFPALVDDEMGFRLHQADVAVNKVLCASSRYTAARDAVDLMYIVRMYAPLGPLVWAAVGKKNDISPTQMIGDIRRIVFGYAEEEINAVRMEEGIDISFKKMRSELSEAIDNAQNYCEETAPLELDGHLFVNAAEEPVAADDEAIETGEAVAILLQDFAVIPSIK